MQTSRRRLSLAWAVHLFTAAGAVLAFLALLAVLEHRWTEAMLWLFAALVVDGVDGMAARAAGTRELVPRIDGDALDLVIDYLTYVFIPTFFLWEAELLWERAALPLCALILISSLYTFARRDMKTEDGYFRGFPALWNLVALYLYAGRFDAAVSTIVIVALALLTFAPIHVAHPFRVRQYGRWLPILSVVWAGATFLLLLQGSEQHRSILVLLSASAGVLFLAAGLWRTLSGPKPLDQETSRVS